MITPYAGERAPAGPPVATLILIGATFAVFGVVAAATLAVGSSAPVTWFAATALAPGSVRWYTPLTYWLLHEHLLHVSVNMLFVFVFGSAVEGAIGTKRLMLLFLSAAAVTGLAEAGAAAYGPVEDAGAMVVGASGAVAGVLGAFAALFRASRLHLGVAGWSVRTLPVILLMALGEVASVGWRGLSSHAFAPPSAANWAHIVGFLYGITWIWAAERVWFLRGGGLYATGRTTPEEEAPFAAVARWERALEADPHDHEALVRLPTALALAGDADRAVTCAANAVSEALRRGDAASAAERFVALQDLEPHRSMTDDLALDAATALAEGGSPELAVTVSDHVAQRTAADDLRARSEVRSALCLMRHLRRPREAAERLQTMLGRATDPEWRAYVTRLLREAESADPKA